MYLFWERETERETDRQIASTNGGGTEKETENPKQAPHCQLRAQHKAQTHELWDYDLIQNEQLDT